MVQVEVCTAYLYAHVWSISGGPNTQSISWLLGGFLLFSMSENEIANMRIVSRRGQDLLATGGFFYGFDQGKIKPFTLAANQVLTVS